MVDRVEKMRQKQNKLAAPLLQKPSTVPPADSGVPASVDLKSNKNTSTPLTLTFACGHVRSVVKLIQHRCESCIQQAQAEQKKHQAERKQQRNLKRANQRKEQQDTQRLPHGSRFEMSYDAVDVLWTGRLIIPASGPTDATIIFEASARAVFELNCVLDELYRTWLSIEEAPTSG